MEIITQNSETDYDSGSQSEGMCQYQGHFLNSNTFTSVENHCISSECGNEFMGGKS